VCERCTLFLSEAEPICPRCYRENISGEVHPGCQKGNALDGLVSVWEYEGLMKSLLRTINEGGVSHAVFPTTELAFQHLIEQRERYTSFFQTLFSANGAITFVPRFPREERRRGFNQAFLIAQAVGQLSGKQPFSLLRKLNDTTFQDDWGFKKRGEVLEDSFSLEKSLEELPENIVLVDDLWQSGVTLNECAAVLKRAGVEKVWGFTLTKVA